MFARLTRSRRLAAGRLVALLYLLCVLAPGAALAFGSGPVPCFEETQASLAHVHDEAMMMGMMPDGMAGHHGEAADQTSALQSDAAAGHHGHDHHHGKNALGPCCALMCISAMPADLPSVMAAVAKPVSAGVFESDRSLRSEAPPCLYRPPIA